MRAHREKIKYMREDVLEAGLYKRISIKDYVGADKPGDGMLWTTPGESHQVMVTYDPTDESGSVRCTIVRRDGTVIAKTDDADVGWLDENAP
jgi:hypothetical protein